MHKLLSISVAAYNVSATIRQCLDSFVASSFIDLFEIIVVNDGSKDDTVSIVREYVRNYPNTIRLIDKKNGGHGSTINASSEVATGKYFKVVDGDDWVDTKAFDKFLQYLLNTDCDLILSNYMAVYPDHKSQMNVAGNKSPNMIYTINDLEKKPPMHSITIKLSSYKSLCLEISEHRFYVDLEFDTFALMASNTISFCPEYVYQYRLGTPNQSVSMNGYFNHIEDLIFVVSRLLRLYASTYSYKMMSTHKENLIFSIISDQYDTIFGCFIHFKKVDKDHKLAEFDYSMRKSYPQLVNRIDLGHRNIIRLNYSIMLPLLRIAHNIAMFFHHH